MILEICNHQRHETLEGQCFFAIHAHNPVHCGILCAHICARDDFVTDNDLDVVGAEVPGIGEGLRGSIAVVLAKVA